MGILATMVSFQAVKLLKENPTIFTDTKRNDATKVPLPLIVRTMWAVWSIILPMSIIIALVYWLILSPFWKLKTTPSLSNVFKHGINTCLIVLDAFLSGVPLRFSYIANMYG